jgi:hypothetical protein
MLINELQGTIAHIALNVAQVFTVTHVHLVVTSPIERLCGAFQPHAFALIGGCQHRLQIIRMIYQRVTHVLGNVIRHVAEDHFPFVEPRRSRPARWYRAYTRTARCP